MIIDSHIHLGEMLNFTMTETMILESMEKYNIDFGLVSNIEASEVDHQQNLIPEEYTFTQIEANTRTLNFVKDNYDRVRGLFWIKPLTEGFSREVEDFLLENKKYFCGIKMHPYHSKIKITDKKVAPYLEFANKYKLPFVVHTAGDKYSDSENVYRAAIKYPDVNFVLVHMGLGTNNIKAINRIKKLPNVYGDTTWVKFENVIKAVRECGGTKILFGTDSPIDGVDTYKKYEGMIALIREKTTKEEAEEILSNNAKKIFGI